MLSHKLEHNCHRIRKIPYPQVQAFRSKTLCGTPLEIIFDTTDL